MVAFNTWYYSFSPSVANEIYANPTSQGIMQVTLYPLLSILQVSSSLFDVFSFQAEFAALLAGFVASGMIGIFYLSVPTLLLCRRYRSGVKRAVKPLLTTLGAGLVGLAIAEVIANPTLAAFSSATIVLANLLLWGALPCLVPFRKMWSRKVLE